MTETLLPENIDFNARFPAIKRRLRLGIVGGGRIASLQANAARSSNRWDVVAGALSSQAEQAVARGANWYLPEERCYFSFEAMAQAESTRSDGVDAVMITTPNHLHHDAAQAFLEVGIDVLCDKPLSNTLEDALSLQTQVDRSGCVFGVCYTMSCFPMVRQARQIVAEGGIGRINQIHVEFLQDWMTPDDAINAPHVQWRLDPAKSGKTSCTGDIGTHAAHLASFVSGLRLNAVKADLHVCGAPKALEDTVFMMTHHHDPKAGTDVPGTLIATRLAPGNRGGLRLRIFGSEGGLEWDLENAEHLKFARFGEADRILSRGHGHGISPSVERLIHTARGFPEGIIEAWSNLYTEFALAVAARRDGIELPPDWLGMPRIDAGVEGVRFIDATVASHESGGVWQTLT